jgi:hypothetical protein
VYSRDDDTVAAGKNGAGDCGDRDSDLKESTSSKAMDSDDSCDDDDHENFSLGRKEQAAKKPVAKGGAKMASKFPSNPVIPTHPPKLGLAIAADDQPMVAVPEPAAAAKIAPAKAKAKTDDDDDFDLEKAAPKPKAAKKGGAAVAKAAKKANAKEDSPVAAHDRPASLRHASL